MCIRDSIRSEPVIRCGRSLSATWAVSYTHLDVYKRQEDALGYASTTVFRRTVHGTAVPHILPDHLRDLDAHGFNAFEFQSEARRDGGAA